MILSREYRDDAGLLYSSAPVNNNMYMQILFRQALYRLFCSVFLYPDEEMLIDLQMGVTELLNSSGYWNEYAFAENLQQLISNIIDLDLDDRKPLVNEYNRLFLVKPKVPPYETTYLKLTGQSQGMIGADLSGIYGSAGLVVSPEMNELPDHIAVQLEFMSFLCKKESTALQENNQPDLIAAQQEQRSFLNNHLARWFPSFAKKALEEANSDLLYRQVVETTFGFLRNELGILNVSL
jgi:TorA maturation chaperone TorD